MARGAMKSLLRVTMGAIWRKIDLRKKKCYLAPTPVTREVEEGEIGR